jgi:hypothetical protein
MSIQINTKYRLLDYITGSLGVVWQIWKRAFHGGLPKVFFRYQTYRTHTGFASYYNDPPMQWSNWLSADLLHWINYPFWIDSRPFLIESNDHPLSAVAWKKRVSEPIEVLRLIESAQTVYEHKNCKAILIPCDGFRDLFSEYFSDEVCKKIIEVPQIICNQREVDWSARSKLPVAFCCLASDYSLKGVDLVIKAWLSIANRNQSKLFLACPNIPPKVQELLKSEKSIVMISKAPLTPAEKAAIFHITHVSLAPTHVHGGANVAEGLEYGHIPLMFEYHARYFRGFGSTISVPYHFYTPEGYGKTWKTFKDFHAQLAADKLAGVFDCVIESLALEITKMIDSPEVVLNSEKECHRLGAEHFSSSVRNEKLLNLYHQILSGIKR